MRGIAELLAAGGQVEQAVEFLAFVRDFPSTFQFTRNRASRALDLWSAKLSPEVVAAALKRAQALDVDTVFTSALAAEPI